MWHLTLPVQSLDEMRHFVQNHLDRLTLEGDLLPVLVNGPVPRDEQMRQSRLTFVRQPLPLKRPGSLKEAVLFCHTSKSTDPPLPPVKDDDWNARLLFDMDDVSLGEEEESTDEADLDEKYFLTRYAKTFKKNILCWVFDDEERCLVLDTKIVAHPWTLVQQDHESLLMFVMYHHYQYTDRLFLGPSTSSTVLPSSISHIRSFHRVRQVRRTIEYSMDEIEPTLVTYKHAMFDLFSRRLEDYKVAHLGLFHSETRRWQPTESERRRLVNNPPCIFQVVTESTNMHFSVYAHTKASDGNAHVLLMTCGPETAVSLVRKPQFLVFSFFIHATVLASLVALEIRLK